MKIFSGKKIYISEFKNFCLQLHLHLQKKICLLFVFLQNPVNLFREHISPNYVFLCVCVNEKTQQIEIIVRQIWLVRLKKNIIITN